MSRGQNNRGGLYGPHRGFIRANAIGGVRCKHEKSKSGPYSWEFMDTIKRGAGSWTSQLDKSLKAE